MPLHYALCGGVSSLMQNAECGVRMRWRNRGVDYDSVAGQFDRRYEINSYDGVEQALDRFIGGQVTSVAEAGCGTGHWLARIQPRVARVVGLDPSFGMLRRARTNATRARIVQAQAEHLPCADAVFDRIFCINAFHHFTDPKAFVTEAARTLRPGGALMTIGLDPHSGLDRWWIYDYFPRALDVDLKRYVPASTIREWMIGAGFGEVRTELAQHIQAEEPYERAVANGRLEKRSTSQLMILSEEEYEAGCSRLERDRPTLVADLRMYATYGLKEGPG